MGHGVAAAGDAESLPASVGANAGNVDGTCLGDADFMLDYSRCPYRDRSDSAATQCLLFAVGVWVMRYRSIAVWMAGLVATIIFTSVIASHATFVNTPTTALWIACGVVIVSLAIMYDAYRRWLNTELG